MFVGVGGGQHDRPVRTGRGDQPSIEIIVGRERAATLQSEDAVHLGERTRDQTRSTDSNVASVASVTPIDFT